MPKRRRRVREVFSFDELSGEAKKRAIQTWRDRGWDFDEADARMLTEFFEEELRRFGLPSGDVRWRLSYSQGDGVAFYGPVDLDEFIRAETAPGRTGAPEEWTPPAAKPGGRARYEPLVGRVRVAIRKVRELTRYDHYNTMVVDSDAEGDLTDRDYALLGDLEAEIAAVAREASRELEKLGYQEIDYRTGDEQIAESIESGDFEFTEDGRLMP